MLKKNRNKEEKDIRYTKGNSSSTVEHSIVVGDTSVRFCGFALLLLWNLSTFFFPQKKFYLRVIIEELRYLKLVYF